MTWGNPEVFWLLFFLVPFAGLCVYWLRDRARLLALIGSSRSMQIWNRSAVLLGLGVVCIFVALAQPRDGHEELQLARENRDIVVVLDVSQSMLAEDVLPNRMERARWEVRSLLEQLKGERVALVLFAKRAYVRMPLSKEYAVLEKLLAESHPKNITAQGSDLGAAMRVAADLFSQEDGARSIVLVSDGEDHEAGLEGVAEQLSKKGIFVYSLGLGTKEGGVIPRVQGGYVLDEMGELVKSKRMDESLLFLAKQTGGKFAVSQAGLGDWDTLYNQGIAKQASSGMWMEEEKIWNELFFWPLGLGLLLCLSSYGVRMSGSVLLFLFLARPGWSQEVDVRDMNSLEAYALSLYDQGQYRQAEQLLNEVARSGDSRSMRDRARYNSSLAAYQQGKLGQALEALDAMERPNSQSVHNAQYIQKEIEERRKNAQQAPQQEEQDQQGEGESSDQEGEQGEGQQESERQDASKQESGQSDAQEESEEAKNNEQQGDSSEQEGQQEPSEGIPQEALSPEEWSKREAQRLLDSVEEGQHRGFGQEGESSSGTKTW